MIRIADVLFPVFSGFVSFSAIADGFVSALTPRDAVVSDFFEVHSIAGNRSGDDVFIDFDRSIYEPIVMGFTVRVMERSGAGWSEFCQMEALPFEYLTGSVLPDPIDLDWWTHGKCADPPDSSAQIWTVWTPADESLQPVVAVFDIPPK